MIQRNEHNSGWYKATDPLCHTMHHLKVLTPFLLPEGTGTACRLFVRVSSYCCSYKETNRAGKKIQKKRERKWGSEIDPTLHVLLTRHLY